MFNGGIQISLTQSSTLLALPVSSSSSSPAVVVSLRQHLLKTCPHTRLQFPPVVVWPAAGVKLLFTLAEFSAHVGSKMRARKRIMGDEGAGAGAGVIVPGYLSLVLVGVELVLLFKRNMLFLGSWFVALD